MSEAIILQDRSEGSAMSVAELRSRLAIIQDTMRSVMVDGSDYGVIPGTNKPTLYKPGAEKLCLTFHLTAGDPLIEAVGDYAGEVRYRVQVPIRSSSGRLLAVGVGECSSAEEKYCWRRPVHENEFLAAAEDRRRVKFQRNGEAWQQVRVSPADVANTILKMSHKRAYVHGVIMATAAGSIFTQDAEDLPEGAGDEGKPASVQTPIRKPKPAEAPPKGAGLVVVVGVKSIEVKTGMGAKGKWAKASITASDGHTYGTFDTKYAELAELASRSGETLEIGYTETKYGRDVVTLKAGPAGPRTVDAPGADEIPF